MSTPVDVTALKPCPFCGCAMNRVAHSAFHRTDSTLPASCWMATAGDHGGSYELLESEYPAWNRRAGPPDEATFRARVKAIIAEQTDPDWAARLIWEYVNGAKA